jgi:hypothetical protein
MLYKREKGLRVWQRMLIVSHTAGVVLIGKVLPIRRAWNEDTPKGASNLTFLQTRQIHMTWEGAMNESLGEVGGVDVIVKQRSDLDREIIMTI